MISNSRAISQETYYELLLAGQFIDEEERTILKWGRNAKVTIPPRFKASGKHAETYKHATAMECLVRPSMFGVNTPDEPHWGHASSGHLACCRH